MPGPLFANNATGTLASSYSSTATAITLTAGQGGLFPSPGAGEWFMATIVNNLNSIEIVKVTSRTADTFTVVRGQEGTPPRSLAAGEKIENRLTAGALDAIRTAPADPSLITDNSIGGAKLTDASIAGIKIIPGAISTREIADGSVGPTKLAPGAALSNLGFTPVNQGGGVGQLSDNVFLGWTNRNKLALTVGVTDLGYLLSERNDGSAESAGYRALWPNTQNNDYTMGAVDNGRSVLHTAGSHNYFLPNETVPLNQGAVIQIMNVPGAGAVNIVPAGGVQLTWLPSGVTGSRSLAAAGVATVQKIGGNNWVVYGAGLT